MFVHNLGKMMELVASLSRKLLFPIYGEVVAIAQATTSSLAPHTKSCKVDPNVEMLFQIEATEDIGVGGGK